MDNLSLPVCAMYRQSGTVIVKNEDLNCCRRSLNNSRTDFERTPGKCEKCELTRTTSKYSECVSATVIEKSRPYRASAARSRYVNVCAAVCLLLLVGGLSPQSSAAPHRRVKMERHRRDTQENYLWENPCDYEEGSSKSTKVFSRKDVTVVANQARNALVQAESYKDKVSQVLLDRPDFEAVVSRYEGTPWLHSDKFKSFMAEEVLPKNKIKLEQTMSPEFLNNVVSEIDSHLPSMQKALKMLVACLNAVKKGLNTNLVGEVKLQNIFDKTMNSVRQVLCVFNEVMDTRKVEEIPMLVSEIPDVTADDRVITAILIYRDTLLYLDYLSQLMEVWGHQD